MLTGATLPRDPPCYVRLMGASSAQPASAGVTFLHLGAVVPDLEVAMADFGRLGAGSWQVHQPTSTWAFDFSLMRTVRQRNARALATIPGLGGVELIKPDPDLPIGPQPRLLDGRAGLTHVAYSCPDLAAAASQLLDAGARLFSFVEADDDEAQRLALLATSGERRLLGELTNCYVEVASGSIVELVRRARRA